jgi:hypothetical protein
MRIRIVTATRGQSPFWAATADSIAALAPRAEHVVVAAPAVARALSAAASRPRLVPEVGPGLYPNVNAGAAAAGEWDAVTWLNDDDVLAPGFGTLVARMEREPDIGIAFGRVALIDGGSRRVGELPVAHRVADLPALLAQGIVPFAQPGTLIRRAMWERVGGVDTSYRLAGDLDFFVRALAQNVRFEFVNAEVAAFRLSAGQLSKRREEVERETGRALQPLTSTSRSRAARWRFRLANLPTYLSRVRRHGWISMRELYDRTE